MATLEPPNSAPTPSSDAPAPGPNPRAFAQGTGIVLQTVGVLLLLSTCCICAVSGAWLPTKDRGQVMQEMSLPQPAPAPTPLWRDPARFSAVVMVFLLAAGGLAMAAFGLGMQSERLAAAWGAVLTCALLLLLTLAAGVALWLGDGHPLPRLWNAAMVLLLAVLTGFSWAGLRQIQRHPPPPYDATLPRDFDLDALRHRH